MPLCPNHPLPRQHASYLPTQLPLYLFSAAEPGYLVDPFAVLDYVDHWEGLSDATYAWPSRFSAFPGILKGRGFRHCSISTSGYRGQGSDDSSV